jgi:hypothetical protein
VLTCSTCSQMAAARCTACETCCTSWRLRSLVRQPAAATVWGGSTRSLGPPCSRRCSRAAAKQVRAAAAAPSAAPAARTAAGAATAAATQGALRSAPGCWVPHAQCQPWRQRARLALPCSGFTASSGGCLAPCVASPRMCPCGCCTGSTRELCAC